MTDSLIWRSIAHRRKLFLVFIAVGLGVLPVLLTIFKPSYTGTAHVVLVSENTQRDPLVKGPDIPVLASSLEVLSRVKAATGIEATIKSIRSHLAVKSNSEVSNMITVSFRDHDPRLAVAVANSVSDEAVKYFHRLSVQQYDRLISYLTGQIATHRNAIEGLDHQIQHAAQADSFVSTDKAIDTITGNLDVLQGKLGDAMATLTADRAAADAAARQPAEVAGIMRDQQLQSDPLFQNLRTTHARDAAQLGAIKAQYTDRYPGLPSLQEQVRNENTMVEKQKQAALASGFSSSPVYAQTVLDHRKALAMVAGDEARVAQYNSQITEQQRRLADMSNTGVSVAVLRAERDTAMANYQTLSTQLTTVKTNQAEASSLGSLVVVDRASDVSALFESMLMRIIVGVIAVFAIALMLAVIVEVADPRLRTPNDIERLYGRPVIATVGS
jgi:uncharacterized protein involved in exopolysaccharide biosynthesis